jgi:hypothetical protein
VPLKIYQSSANHGLPARVVALAADFLVALLFHRRDINGRCAAEQRHELAATDHSITSSARALNMGGNSKSSAFAVLRLITSSNLTDCITGRSAGFSPLRILAV